MAALPYIPLYVADYLADTSHLSTLEHGAYLLLIMNYWQRGEPLPASDLHLSRIARLTPEEWASVKPSLEPFFIVETDAWRHGRIEIELAKVLDKSTKASDAGKASAKQRANKRSTGVEQTFNHTDTDTDTISPLPPLKEFPEEEFFKFIASYPKRDVPIVASKARDAFEDAVEQSSIETITASLKVYIDECKADDRIGTKFVKQPQNWLADQDWQKLKAEPALFPVTPVFKDTPEWEALKKKNGGKLFAYVLRDPDTQKYLGEGTWTNTK